MTKKKGEKERKNKRYSKELIEQWKELYESGESTYTIGAKFGSQSSAVRCALIRIGCKMRPPKVSKFTQAEYDDIAQMYKSGVSAPKIGEKYHKRTDVICRVLRSLGVQLRRYRGEQIVKAERPKSEADYSAGHWYKGKRLLPNCIATPYYLAEIVLENGYAVHYK